MDIMRLLRTFATVGLIFVIVALIYLFCNLIALICIFSPVLGLSLFAAVTFIGMSIFMYRVH